MAIQKYPERQIRQLYGDTINGESDFKDYDWFSKDAVSEIHGDRCDSKLLSDAAEKSDHDLVIDRRAEDHRKTLYKQDQERFHQPQGDHDSR